MQNYMWKKGFVVGIIILFFCAGVLPSVSGNLANVNTTDYNINNSSATRWVFYIGLINNTRYHPQLSVEFDILIIFYVEKIYDDGPINHGVYLYPLNTGYYISNKIGIITNHFVFAIFFLRPPSFFL